MGNKIFSWLSSRLVLVFCSLLRLSAPGPKTLQICLKEFSIIEF